MHSPRTSDGSGSPRLPIDLDEPPPPRVGANAPLIADSSYETKPRLERSLSRSLNRHTYSRSSSSTNVNEVLHLRKTLELLSQTFEAKEKEVNNNINEKQKQEELVIKLTTDLKGAHILIQTLQKENQTQGQHRDKLAAGGSVVMRQQKKIKMFKEQLEKLESENSELKKELQSLKKKKKPKT